MEKQRKKLDKRSIEGVKERTEKGGGKTRERKNK